MSEINAVATIRLLPLRCVTLTNSDIFQVIIAVVKHSFQVIIAVVKHSDGICSAGELRSIGWIVIYEIFFPETLLVFFFCLWLWL